MDLLKVSNKINFKYESPLKLDNNNNNNNSNNNGNNTNYDDNSNSIPTITITNVLVSLSSEIPPLQPNCITFLNNNNFNNFDDSNSDNKIKIIKSNSFDDNIENNEKKPNDISFEKLIIKYNNNNNNKNIIKEIKLLGKKGHSPSLTWLGVYYYNEKKNFKKSIIFFKKAEKRNNGRACFELFKYYKEKYNKQIQNKKTADNNNYLKKSINYLEKSLNLNYELAIYTIANYRFYGNEILIDQDFNKSFQLYSLLIKNSENNQDSKYYINSLRELGHHFYNGLGGNKIIDYSEAYRIYYYTSVIKNDSNSFYHLGKCLYNGNGVEKNIKLAKEWFEKSHNNGDINGTNALNQYYLNK